VPEIVALNPKDAPRLRVFVPSALCETVLEAEPSVKVPDPPMGFETEVFDPSIVIVPVCVALPLIAYCLSRNRVANTVEEFDDTLCDALQSSRSA
jgi:hypothetical protein